MKKLLSPIAIGLTAIILLALPYFVAPKATGGRIEAAQLPDNGMPIFVEFYSDHCPTCEIMAPGVKNLEREFAGKVNFVYLNVDEPSSAALAERFDVFAIPAFHVLDCDREVKASYEGATEIPTLRKKLEELL